jgi:hypothetical protein
MPYRRLNRLEELMRKLKAWLKFRPKGEPEPGSPDDPFAYVGAPKKPRTPNRSAAAAESLD